LEKLKVVYVTEGNIWLWTQAGGSTQLTFTSKDCCVEISGRGDRIAFLRDQDLWIMKADGTEVRLLFAQTDVETQHSPGTTFWEVAWSPDGSFLYFNFAEPWIYFTEPSTGLVQYNLDKNTYDHLLNRGSGHFSISPDGQYIAISTAWKVFLARLGDPNGTIVFEYPQVVTYSELNYLPQVTWMNDSSGFMFVIPPRDELQNPNEESKWYFVTTSGTPFLRASFGGWDRVTGFPEPSPDGKYLAYSSFDEEDGMEILVLDETGNQIDVVQRSVRNPWIDHFIEWLPDSSGFVFGVEGVPPHLWDLETKTTQKIYDHPVMNISWIDDKYFLLIQDSRLLMIDLDGKQLIISTNAESYAFSNH